nr:LytTR family DNA-binding domain-containing protein [Allomuricauda sp.]
MHQKATIPSDKWMFVYIYPLLGLLVVHIGNENTFKELIQIPSYYYDVALAITCSCMLGIYIKRLFLWMNRKLPWNQRPKKRFAVQFLLGIVLPTTTLIFIETVYLFLLNIKLEDSSIFYLELPLIFIFCLLINLIYTVLYYNQLVKGFQKQEKNYMVKDHKSHFVVQKGKRWLNIPLDEVAYFKIEHKLTFLVTHTGESYLYDMPFKEILPSLPDTDFFQLNRQVIAKRNSILKTIPTRTRRLEIELSPHTDDHVFVPKTKTSNFKTWLTSV